MNANRFLFSTSFDQDSEDQVKKITLTVEDWEAQKQKAFDEGMAEGQQQALASLEQQRVATLEKMAALFPSLQQLQTKLIEETEAGAVQIALITLKLLFPQLAEQHAQSEIMAIVKQSLQTALEEPFITIRLSEADLETSKPDIDELIKLAGFQGKLNIIADPALSATDCAVEWSTGGTERRLENLWATIAEMIRQHYGNSLELDQPESSPLPQNQEEDAPKDHGNETIKKTEEEIEGEKEKESPPSSEEIVDEITPQNEATTEAPAIEEKIKETDNE